MRVLAVVYCLPPLLVPAAMCYLKILVGLRERGVDVEAMAIDPSTFVAPGPGMEDPSLLRLVPRDLTIHWVRSPEAHPIVRALKHSRLVREALYRAFFPRKREWVFAAKRTLRQLDLSAYDVILTCSQPHANHLLGLEIKRTVGTPWVAYFSDPWSGNPYASTVPRQIRTYLRQLETQVLAEADAVLYTSPEMERLAQSEFPEILHSKTGVLTHGYVPEWYGLEPWPKHEPGPLRFLHTGHFYGPRTPSPLLTALDRLSASHDLGPNLVFDFYGSFPEKYRVQLRGRGLEPIFRIHGTVPYLESLALMRGDDAMLLIDAPLSNQSESVFLPSKLVDYLGSGKPIVALTPREGASARVLRQVGGACLDVADATGIETYFKQLVQGMPLAVPIPERVAAYHYLHVASQLIAVLERVVRS